MAHTVTITKLLEGPRHAIFHVYLKCDGASGEVVDQVIIDPVDLMPPQRNKPALRIDELWWDFSGFVVRFEFNSIPDTPVWTISPGTNHICFGKIGGLADRSSLDGTGALQFSTVGFDNAAKQGTMIVKITK